MPHYKSWLGSQLQGVQLCLRRSIFFSFVYIDLKLLTQLPFVPPTISQAWVCSFRTEICGSCPSTLFIIYLSTYQACEAGESIIGHRGIRFVCVSVVCHLSVCLSVCLSSNSSRPMGPIITKIHIWVL